MNFAIDRLREQAAGHAVTVLGLFVPALLALGLVLGTGGLVEAALMAAVTVLVWIERRRDARGLAVQLAAAAGLAVAVAAFVWLMRGHPWQADAHMAFFAAFALTLVFCDWRPILLYAGLIAAHHLVLNYALTAAVFPGEASLGRVLMHAVILILQAIPMIWVACVLNRLFSTSATSLARTEEAREGADAARQQAERLAAQTAAERTETAAVVEALSAAMESLANGNLQATIATDLPPRFAGLRAHFDAMAEVIRGMLGQIERSAGDLKQSADDLATVADQNAELASEQSATLGAALDQLAQMAESAVTATGRAETTSGRVDQNRTAAEDGGRILTRAVEAMQRIEASAEKIGHISEVMGEIAFQTNLLALNAGVEAARAGDSGRGFAVVATEVRALAQRAATSSHDIRALVVASRDTVNEGAQLVRQGHSALSELITGTVDNAAQATEIAGMMRRQSVDLDTLRADLRRLEDVARHGADLADRSSRMSNALKTDSQGLAAAATTFRAQGASPGTTPRKVAGGRA